MCTVERIELSSAEWQRLNSFFEINDRVRHDLREVFIFDPVAINAVAVLVHLAFGNSRRSVKDNIAIFPSEPVAGYDLCLAGIEMLRICDDCRIVDYSKPSHIEQCFMPILHSYIEYYGF